VNRFILPVAIVTVLALSWALYRVNQPEWGDDGRVWLDIEVGGISARVELAATGNARREGLMQRPSLAADEGMLLVFPRALVLEMWMLNTLIPLDVGFFDRQGRLINWLSMEPDGGRRIHTSSAPARYALEMNQGWFTRHHIRTGARLVLPHPVDAR
jgi:uncharacterized membrane protein (UPF0127 family)